MSRFRPVYRELDVLEKGLLDSIKNKAAELEHLFNQVQSGTPSRLKALAITALEESVMWCVKDLTDAPRPAPTPSTSRIG